jgi:glycerol-3-phosphate acyltransferase PlsY
MNMLTNTQKWRLLLALVALTSLAAVAYVLCFERGSDRVAVSDGNWRVVARVQTGHQRAERVCFAGGGRRLAVACPRYDRVVIYEVEAMSRLRTLRDVKTVGKPMAVAEFDGALYVLQRHSGDARHLQPAFWQRFDLEGNPIGAPFIVGYDADDVAFLPNQRRALVLLSGNREGETNRHEPCVKLVDMTDSSDPRVEATVSLAEFADDPSRLIISQRGTHAGVLTDQSNLVGIDLRDPVDPRLTGSVSLAEAIIPRLSVSDGDAIVLPDRTGSDVVALQDREPMLQLAAFGRPALHLIVTVSPDAGELRFTELGSGYAPRSLRLRGPVGIGAVRLMSVASDPSQSLLAATDRSGGVHLLRFEPAR